LHKKNEKIQHLSHFQDFMSTWKNMRTKTGRISNDMNISLFFL